MAAMLDGPWRSLSSWKKVALAAGISVGATVGYLVYRHISVHEESTLSFPLDVYRSIASYQSNFLDIVNQKSGAQINILLNTEDQSTVNFLIKGSPKQIFVAQCAIETLATDCKAIYDVIEVPQTAFGWIIGRGGETIELINKISGARVNCPRDRGRSLEEKGKITITGTRKEVQSAKEMIMEKVMESETVRKRISQSSALRQKRKPPELEHINKTREPENELLKLNGKVLPSPKSDLKQDRLVKDGNDTAEHSLKSEEILSPESPLGISKLIPSPDLSFQPDEHLEVYVSASENPQHFWIQILGVQSLQLDKLTEEMSRFYNGDSSQEHRVETVIVGDIVAASYGDHGTWNRARVLGNLDSGLVDLYYVDFGDNDELPRENLRSMRSDFLSLPFQAIECSLAGVRPTGEVWTKAALDEFERMTYCAEWKPLLAKLHSYSHFEISSWPNVKLYDNSDGKTLDIGKELIRLGHAVSCEDEGIGLRGDRESRSLQKMLDDVMGATSELSMSCISLSGPADPWLRNLEWSSYLTSSPEVERADIDQSSGFGLLSSSSLIHSPTFQNLSGLVSHILELSYSAVEPYNQLVFENRIQSENLTPLSPLQVEMVHEISSPFISPSFVWDYLTTSMDSSETSLSTTMPSLEIIPLSDISSSESDLICNGTEECTSESCKEGNLDGKPCLIGSDGRYQMLSTGLNKDVQQNQAESGEELQETKQVDFKSKTGKGGADESTKVSSTLPEIEATSIDNRPKICMP